MTRPARKDIFGIGQCKPSSSSFFSLFFFVFFFGEGLYLLDDISTSYTNFLKKSEEMSFDVSLASKAKSTRKLRGKENEI